MQKLYFHIGTHKTGSTAIQKTMQVNRNRLKKSGIVQIPFLPYAKQLMSKEGFSKDAVEETKKYLDIYLNKHKKPLVTKHVISSEALSGNPTRGYRNSNHIAKMLKNAIPDKNFDVRIIVYLRRQDTFVESLYTQMIQQGESYKFPQFLASLPRKSFNWLELLDKYASVFGQNRIIVRPYERCTKGSKSLLGDFFSVIGYEDDFDALTNRANASYSREALELARVCNPSLNYNERKSLRTILQQIAPKKNEQPFSFFTAQERIDFLSQYRKTNCKVEKQYLPKNETLFPGCADPSNVSDSKTEVPEYFAKGCEEVLPLLVKELLERKNTVSRKGIYNHLRCRLRQLIRN